MEMTGEVVIEIYSSGLRSTYHQHKLQGKLLSSHIWNQMDIVYKRRLPSMHSVR